MKPIYDACLKLPLTRRLARALRARLLAQLGLSDAYYEIGRLSRRAGATLMLDVGCFEGRTISRFRESGVNCPIVGFDPLKENADRARENCAELKDVEIVEAALFESDGETSFFVNRNRQTSSLLDNDRGNAESFQNDTAHESVVKVSTCRMDTWLGQARWDTSRIIVKCDVQGSEESVVRGGMGAFAKNVIAFYSEVQLLPMYGGQTGFQRLNQVLTEEFNFVLKDIYPCLHDARGRAVQTDMLWVKNSMIQ